MYSRAHLLIQKDIDEIQNEPDIYIVQPSQSNIFDLIALIDGPPNTIWSEGVFQVYMKFTETYNETPPQCFFQTIPYHPNIDCETGRPSLDFLEPNLGKWKPNEHSIKHILKSLQQLLANPLLDRAVNMDAVFMLKGNPVQYESVVRQSVLATQDIRKFLNRNNIK